jgi:hypothetical protein
MKRTTNRETQKDLLLKRLEEAEYPLAVHEFNIIGHSENSLATMASNLAREGLIEGRVRKGFQYKEWALAGRLSGDEPEPKPVVEPTVKMSLEEGLDALQAHIESVKQMYE